MPTVGPDPRPRKSRLTIGCRVDEADEQVFERLVRRHQAIYPVPGTYQGVSQSRRDLEIVNSQRDSALLYSQDCSVSGYQIEQARIHAIYCYA